MKIFLYPKSFLLVFFDNLKPLFDLKQVQKSPKKENKPGLIFEEIRYFNISEISVKFEIARAKRHSLEFLDRDFFHNCNQITCCRKKHWKSLERYSFHYHHPGTPANNKFPQFCFKVYKFWKCHYSLKFHPYKAIDFRKIWKIFNADVLR